MKFSEAWLREWVDPKASTDEITHQLTMAGLEVDGVEPAAPPFSGVVVGEVLEIASHPNADKLSVCQVETGNNGPLEIVCGATNVFPGMRAPTALVGAELPGGIKLRKTKLRGVASQGMLCSARELGLGEDADGIMPLSEDAAVGTDVREYLELDDTVIDLDLTPNRGDCFSVAGVAREIAVINKMALRPPTRAKVKPAIKDVFPIALEAPDACPAYTGCVVRNIRSHTQSPVWMRERLRRSGLRPIHPVVDVTNYVMLELGQPLHAFDLRHLNGGIVVRLASAGEKLTLLDGRTVGLDPEILVIADHEEVKALAGIMGGEHSGVTDDTTDIFFEGAFFSPLALAGRARRLGLHTDASLRFERGVDPALQIEAVERATQLLIDIAGGEPGPVTQERSAKHMPRPAKIKLRKERVELLLGARITKKDIADILKRLGMKLDPLKEGWRVVPPSFRFDLGLEADLIEEVGRIYGYENIPETPQHADVTMPPVTETRLSMERVRDLLVDRGYQEAITYSFVDPALQALFAPGETALSLANPISSEMSAMRLSLWPGLIQALVANQSRQQGRVRLFEVGVNFHVRGDETLEKNCLAGVISGDRYFEQWGVEKQAADFFDIKGDVEAILALTARAGAFRVRAGRHAALHPGQSAELVLGGETVGRFGRLHPALMRQLDLAGDVFLFELEIGPVFASNVPVYEPISKYPAVRRDIAAIVDEGVTVADISSQVEGAAGSLLKELKIFDIYRGKGIDSGRKSVALGLILQETSRTLTDQDADALVQRVVRSLEQNLNATIRD